MKRNPKWYLGHRLWVEVFVLINLASLAGDIYLAHSTNAFRHSAEYVPLLFSFLAPVLLLPAILSLEVYSRPLPWKLLGHLVGWVSVVIAITGVVLHLDSHFFHERTLVSLVYAAPFAAPLSYAGLGLLLIMNRMVDSESREWPYWVLLLTLGGFAGNFLFSVTDHAQNGFYVWTEWVPVGSSELAVGFLAVPFMMHVTRSYLVLCTAVMFIQAAVGILGFYFHLTADMRRTGANFFDKIIYNAPILVPLLFPDLVMLSFIGMWTLYWQLPDAAVPPAEAENTRPAIHP